MIKLISISKLCKIFLLNSLFGIITIFSLHAGNNCNFNFNINNPNLKNITIKSNGIDRSFLVYTPNNYNSNLNNKVVFMFHGTSQDGMKMFKKTAWNLKADQENFIVIYPNSLCYYLLDEAAIKSRWNDGNLRLNTKAHTILADDVKYFEDMLAWVENYRVSKNNNNPVSTQSKIYICGFSNGAMFGSRLLYEMSDKISAAGLVSTILPKTTANFNQKINPVPTIIIYGTKDQRVLDTLHILPNQFPKTPNDFSAVPLFNSIINWHLIRNKLAANFSNQTTNKKYKLIYNTPKNGISDSKKYFEIQVYKGLEHEYPVDTSPNGINATDIFNDFFNQH